MRPTLNSFRGALRRAPMGFMLGLLLASSAPLFAQVGGADQAPGPEEAKAQQRAAAESIARRGAAASRASASLQRREFQVRALAQTFEGDPSAAVRWVAEKTRWVPYQGALRGAAGVLQDRHGSHLDRALLLAELLEVLGSQVQLARATLPADAADSIVASALGAPPLPVKVDSGLSVGDGVVAAIARVLKIEPAVYRGALAASQVRQSTQFEDALGVCLPIAGDLLELIGEAPGPEGAQDERATLAARDLWWVQSRSDEESPWNDRFLHPYDSNPIAGSVCLPRELPPEVWHQLEVRVEIERKQGSRLTVEPLLVETLVPAQLLGKPVSLTVQCLDPLPRAQANEPSEAYRRRVLLAADYWMPVLRIGERVVGQAGFELDGSVDVQAVKSVTSRRIGQAADLIAGLGAATGAPGDEDTLLALRCIFTTSGPGAPTRRSERVLHDLLTPEERAALPALPGRDVRPADEDAEMARALELAAKVELLAWGFCPSLDWLEALTLRRMADNARPESALATALPAGDRAEVIKQFKIRTPDDSHLWAVASARHRWNPMGAQLAARELQLLAFHSRHLPHASEGELALRLRFDWMANRLDPVPGREGEGRGLRILQGVVDTYAEAATLELFGAVEENAARAHEIIGGNGRVPALATDESLGALGPRGRHWRAARQAGHVIAMIPGPDDTVSTAWRIDPVTGQTLGIDLEGHGNAFADYCLQLQIRVEMWIAEHKTLAIAICIACKAGAQLTSLIPSELESIGCGAWCLAAGAG